MEANATSGKKPRGIGRHSFPSMRRIVIKFGNSTVTHPDGTFALGRLGSLVEQIAELMKNGKDVILVSSGAVAKGAQVLNEQALLSAPMRSHIRNPGSGPSGNNLLPPRACAAAGQSGLMTIYDVLFYQKGLSVAQILVTDTDFKIKEAREALRQSIDNLLQFDVVPVINENIAISVKTTQKGDPDSRLSWKGDMGQFVSDNDNLAAQIAIEINADLLIILTDTEGIYTANPSVDASAELMSVYRPGIEIDFRPGLENYYHPGIRAASGADRPAKERIQWKIDSILYAIDKGVPAAVIANGARDNVIRDVLKGERIGTLFVKNPEIAQTFSPQSQAVEVRRASQVLRNMSPAERTAIIQAITRNLEKNKESILAANMLDVREAQRAQTRYVDRLALTPARWEAMMNSLRLIANAEDPIGNVMLRREISPGLILQKETTPLGVLLAIFECRPDAIPQVIALAIKSGNGVIVKGGNEAVNTNTLIHQTIVSSITEASNELSAEVPKSLVPMIPQSEDVSVYLELHKEIDLVIPRGSYKLVQTIEKSTRIPVLGHAEGVCHIYLHSDADVETAVRIIKDAKLDSPASSNSVDTVLIHKDLLDVHAKGMVKDLLEAGIRIHADKYVLDLVAQRGIRLPPITTPYHFEYGDNRLSMVAVSSLDEAIDHINSYGSGHTDGIVTRDNSAAAYFGRYVDSACVFHNVSTRYADGIKFGLGVEVGMNTNRIHARGPVGVESLMTTKWRLTSLNQKGHIAADYVAQPDEIVEVKPSVGPVPTCAKL